MNRRSRGWIIVINNYTDDECADVILESENAEYTLCGFEVGKEGTPHLQMYMYYSSARTGTTLKKIFPRAHLEPQKGSNAQARNYVTDNKDKPNADYWEEGILPYQGKLNIADLKKAMEDPSHNISLYHQYRKTYSAIKQEAVKREVKKTSFYKLETNGEDDWLEKILNRLEIDIKDDSKYAVITTMEEIQLYDTVETIILYDFSIMHANQYYLWGKGVNMTYKYGYEYRIIKPTNLVLVGLNVDYWYLKSYTDIEDAIQTSLSEVEHSEEIS